MTRKLLVLPFLVLLASTAIARTRSVSSVRPSGSTVSGVVSSVSGNLVHLADGLVTIDTTGAQIIVDRGTRIEPGMVVFATLRSDAAPLVASMITATSLPDATLTGPVQSVDLGAGSFTLLGRTIFVNSDTSFGGFRRDGRPTLADLMPNDVVVVTADASGGRLVARSVLVVSFTVPTVKTSHGTVKSIGPDSWVVGDLTLVINAQTKIVGNPKVGDEVEVLYSIDSANANIAIVIARFERPAPPPNQSTLFSGKVKSIGPAEWTITLSGNTDTKVRINELTRIQSGIAVGDNVQVVALKNDAGELIALVIIKR